ncbi:centriolar satellite-associated tubulin polyglutamylase complex regulator 1-like isoform X3 [Corticium candelabrum]|uniref:centriolar satellite-associated tubulin polyglutamylase complex regulator 1-like isoform X3 n=1 Tax=Corticium candelabrum TaxID=121492 RepID=UPI002E2639E0|nr:centriolar satellite-associated tubulin polyglutamylase complex regulator 1-like isoform X3 [Corticium candelabrum]
MSESAAQYLKRCHVLTYLQDSIAQLLEHREHNSRANPMRSRRQTDRWTMISESSLLMCLEFFFVKATPQYRLSLVKLFYDCFKPIGHRGDLLNIREYHSLVTLICPDFPLEIIQKTAQFILTDDAMECLVAFYDFIYAFPVQFLYEEFLKIDFLSVSRLLALERYYTTTGSQIIGVGCYS